MEEWYNWLTFDVIGELAFGVSFRGVERAETHPWVVAVKESLHALLFTDLFRRVPLLGWFPWILRKSNLVEGRKRQLRLSHELVLNRMKKNLDQNDFFSHFLSEKQADKSEGFLTINVSALITAGSETTATFFAGMYYYLCSSYEGICTDLLHRNNLLPFEQPTHSSKIVSRSSVCLHISRSDQW